MSQVLLGGKVDATYATNDYNSTGNGIALGTIKTAASGKRYMYVQDSGAGITQYAHVAITDGFKITALTKALADARHRIGAAQVAFTANYYGWVFIGGGAYTGLFKTLCAQNVKLYTSATAGYLDDDATSQTQVEGPYVLATVGGADASASAFATNDMAPI